MFLLGPSLFSGACAVSFREGDIYSISLEVQPPFFRCSFPSHHNFSKGLSSSKRNHHFFLMVVDFQGYSYTSWFNLVFLLEPSLLAGADLLSFPTKKVRKLRCFAILRFLVGFLYMPKKNSAKKKIENCLELKPKYMTPPKFNMFAPDKWWLKNDFPIGFRELFRGYIKLREGMTFYISFHDFVWLLIWLYITLHLHDFLWLYITIYRSQYSGRKKCLVCLNRLVFTRVFSQWTCEMWPSSEWF